MADVINTINIDTTAANASLDKLRKSLNKTNSAMTEFQVTSSGTVETPFDQLAKRAKTAGDEAERTTRRIRKGSADATKAVRGIGLSFQDVGRIVQSQIIFSAISALTSGFGEAAEAAGEFQLQIARIQSITQEAGFNLESMRGKVEDLAVQLGRSFEETGTAVFEALQNDLGTVEETFGRLENEAQNLALVTGGTLPQAVNALSSVLKSYNEEQLKGVDIAGQFFGTINAGRITLKDLESSLGTLLPLASQVDSSFTEVTNALATITLTGTKASVATTQLRNVFNKLIKPTDALKEVYRDLGVSGFKELQERSGGLVKGLEALVDAVDGDEEAVARLFNTIRGNLGVLNVLTDDTELYNKTVERSAIAADDLSNAIKRIDETDARQAARNAAELEKIMTELGDIALSVKVTLGDTFLRFIDDGEEALTTVTALGVGFTTAAIAVKGFGLALATAVPVVTLIASVTGGFILMNEIIERSESSGGKLRDTLAALEIEKLEELADSFQKIGEADVAISRANFEGVLDDLDSIIDKAKTAGEALESAFDVEVAGIKAVEAELITQFADARKRGLDAVSQAIKDIDKEITNSNDTIRDLRQELEDFSFEERLSGLSKEAQLWERNKKAAEDLAAAQDAAANVGLSEESQKTARALAEQAVSSAKAALSAQKSVGGDILRQKAVAKVQEALTAQINIETELNRKRETFGNKDLVEREKQLRRLAAAEQKEIREALEARQKLEDAIKDGESNSFIQGLKEEADREAKEAVAAIQSVDGAKLVKDLGLTDAFETATQKLRDGLSGTHVDWTTAVNDLVSAVRDSEPLQIAAKINAELDDDVQSPQIQEALDNAEGGLPGEALQNSTEAVQGVLENQLTLAQEVKGQAATAEASALKAIGILDQARSKLTSPNPKGAEQAAILADPVIAAIEELGTKSEEQLIKLRAGLTAGVEAAAAAETSIFDLTDARRDELVLGLSEAVTAVDAQLKLIEARKLFNPETLEEAQSIIDKLSELNEEELILEVNDSQVKEANRQLDEVETNGKLGAAAVRTIGTSAGQAVGPVSQLKGITQQLGEQAKQASGFFKQLLKDIQAAIDAAAKAPKGGGTGGNFHGGLQYLANGGVPRGQDTINTQLAPGEFVVNRQATKNFLPELQAINSGTSAGAANGGDTNITIGDVNVTSTSQLPSQTARDVGVAIKRELRRGNLKL